MTTSQKQMHPNGRDRQGYCDRASVYGKNACDKLISLRLVASANVCTLGEHSRYSHVIRGTSETDLIARAAALEESFHKIGLDIVGIQEGRSRESGTVASARYVKYVSAANR